MGEFPALHFRSGGLFLKFLLRRWIGLLAVFSNVHGLELGVFAGVALETLRFRPVGMDFAPVAFLLQLGLVPSLPCSAVGYSASCSQKFVLNFGYITIPLMAFTGFAMIAMAMYIVIKQVDKK